MAARKTRSTLRSARVITPLSPLYVGQLLANEPAPPRMRSTMDDPGDVGGPTRTPRYPPIPPVGGRGERTVPGGSDPGPFEHGPGKEPSTTGGYPIPPPPPPPVYYPAPEPGPSEPGPFEPEAPSGGGPAPEPAAPPITWRIDPNLRIAGAPAWWQPWVPSALDPQAEYAATLNLLIPYMSPEDQRLAASTLSRLLPDPFQGYSPTANPLPPPPKASPYLLPRPGAITSAQRATYTSRARAEGLLNSLNLLAQSMGKTEKDFGPGYQFLQDLASVARDYGGGPGAPQGRAEYRSYLGALDPLLAETQGEALGAYGPMARMFSQPFFSGGLLRSSYRDQTGQWHYGTPNPRFF